MGKGGNMGQVHYDNPVAEENNPVRIIVPADPEKIKAYHKTPEYKEFLKRKKQNNGKRIKKIMQRIRVVY